MPHLIDDRGVRHKMHHYWALRAPDQRVCDVYRQRSNEHIRAVLPLGLFWLMLAIAGAVLEQFDLPPPSQTLGGFVLRALAFMIVLVVLYCSFEWVVRNKIYRSAFLAAGRCPVCHYSLDGLARRSDAEAEPWVICPECGAAWRLPPPSDAASHQPPS